MFAMSNATISLGRHFFRIPGTGNLQLGSDDGLSWTNGMALLCSTRRSIPAPIKVLTHQEELRVWANVPRVFGLSVRC